MRVSQTGAGHNGTGRGWAGRKRVGGVTERWSGVRLKRGGRIRSLKMNKDVEGGEMGG